ncbi:nucleoside/nucleotide kinase family protein [Aquibium sp. LZ166]|uniref:Nucleoside/nucleotide kinase family protein n=1 Tax=Aquibium pacificus TaxID=3153579 RepID=A0ABV3SH50_9HYPH
MSDIAHLAAAIFRKGAGRERVLVAIAGPPAAGKSTLAEALVPLLPEGSAFVLPMDAFHLDNRILEARGLMARKGAPETFDFGGLRATLQRIRTRESDVVIPLFDRAEDFSRAGASVVGSEVKFVLAEGNYLLSDEEPWSGLAPMFDFAVFLDVSEAELERRLTERWLSHGHAPAQARDRVFSNDLPNARRVLTRRRPADMELKV